MIGFPIPPDLVLENDRVRLQPLQFQDYKNLLPYALNEPEIWTYSLVPASGETGMKNYIQSAVEGRTSGVEFPFVVFDKKYGEFAGSTRFYDIQPTNLSLQLGYTWYAKYFQGTGLNQNCKLLLLDYAFEQLQIERVEFRADANNARSIAAMKGIGCTEEGILRSNLIMSNGKRRDSIILSILKHEWENDLRDSLLTKINSKTQ